LDFTGTGGTGGAGTGGTGGTGFSEATVTAETDTCVGGVTSVGAGGSGAACFLVWAMAIQPDSKSTVASNTFRFINGVLY